MSADEIQSIRESLHRIEVAIIGDKSLGHRGLASRMEAVEACVSEHNRKLILWGGIVTGLSLAATQFKSILFKN